MDPISINVSWLCLAIPMAGMALVVFFGIRSRLRYASRFRNAQARGAFEDFGSPEVKSRLQRLAALALLGVIGMTLAFVSMLFELASGHQVLLGITVAAGIASGILASVAGFLIEREFARRLK